MPDSDDSVRLGPFIREARKSKGWDLGEFSQRFTLSAAFIGAIERGEIRRPSDDDIRLIASALEVSPGRMMNFREEDLREAEGFNLRNIDFKEVPSSGKCPPTHPNKKRAPGRLGIRCFTEKATTALNEFRARESVRFTESSFSPRSDGSCSAAYPIKRKDEKTGKIRCFRRGEMMREAVHLPHMSDHVKSDQRILETILMLEYLEAEFYNLAARGSHLSPEDAGVGAGEVIGGKKVDFGDGGGQEYAEELADDELAHVRLYRMILGDSAPPRPHIDFDTAFESIASGIGEPFTPFDDPIHYLVAAILIEDPGVQGYNFLVPLVSDPELREVVSSAYGTEGYHMGIARTLLLEKGGADGVMLLDRILELRSQVTGQDKDQGIVENGEVNLVPADDNGLILSRSPIELSELLMPFFAGSAHMMPEQERMVESSGAMMRGDVIPSGLHFHPHLPNGIHTHLGQPPQTGGHEHERSPMSGGHIHEEGDPIDGFHLGDESDVGAHVHILALQDRVPELWEWYQQVVAAHWPKHVFLPGHDVTFISERMPDGTFSEPRPSTEENWQGHALWSMHSAGANLDAHVASALAHSSHFVELTYRFEDGTIRPATLADFEMETAWFNEHLPFPIEVVTNRIGRGELPLELLQEAVKSKPASNYFEIIGGQAVDRGNTEPAGLDKRKALGNPFWAFVIDTGDTSDANIFRANNLEQAKNLARQRVQNEKLGRVVLGKLAGRNIDSDKRIFKSIEILGFVEEESMLREQEQGTFETQTVIVKKSGVKDKREAAKVAEEITGRKPGKIDEKPETYRFRQKNPDLFVEGSFRTKILSPRVSIVIGKLKE